MTQQVTVQTDFMDLEQMAQGLVGRVQANYVILPTGDAVDEGEWAQFEISLHDGSPGLAGVGRCVTLVDNGDERSPHQRYDVVLDSLQFDETEQQVFEHILALHGVPADDIENANPADAESLPPGADDVHDDAGDYVEVGDFTGQHAVMSSVPPEALADHDDYVESEPDSDRTLTASDRELEAALSNPEVMRPAPGGEANDVVPHASRGATGGTSSATGYSRGGGGGGGVAHALQPQLLDEPREEPLSGERIAPTRGVNGAAFAYANGIPFPAKPPRPALDPSLRVTPAPRPARSSAH